MLIQSDGFVGLHCKLCICVRLLAQAMPNGGWVVPCSNPQASTSCGTGASFHKFLTCIWKLQQGVYLRLLYLHMYKKYMVVSQNKGTPMETQKYFNPYYWDPQNGTHNFGKPPYIYIFICFVSFWLLGFPASWFLGFASRFLGFQLLGFSGFLALQVVGFWACSLQFRDFCFSPHPFFFKQSILAVNNHAPQFLKPSSPWLQRGKAVCNHFVCKGGGGAAQPPPTHPCLR